MNIKSIFECKLNCNFEGSSYKFDESKITYKNMNVIYLGDTYYSDDIEESIYWMKK